MNPSKQRIAKTFDIDIGHRVMDQRFKCSSLHGHRFRFEIIFEYSQQQAIGYPIDFSEIKRLFGGWLDDTLDHGFIINPIDTLVIETCKQLNSKYYLMSLQGEQGYCNPTAENICQEVYLAAEILFAQYSIIQLCSLRLYETPSCYVEVLANSIANERKQHFLACRRQQIVSYRDKMGILEYDCRLL